jgi:hypothetical protein
MDPQIAVRFVPFIDLHAFAALDDARHLRQLVPQDFPYSSDKP